MSIMSIHVLSVFLLSRGLSQLAIWTVMKFSLALWNGDISTADLFSILCPESKFTTSLVEQICIVKSDNDEGSAKMTVCPSK